MATINDLVLVHVDNKPGFYARIEDISPDARDWWVVTLNVLTIPRQEFHWILDSSQVAGEAFSMGGVPVQLEVVASGIREIDVDADIKPVTKRPQGKVVALSGYRTAAR